MHDIHWGGVAAVVALYAVFLLVGWRAQRKVREGTVADLLVAGRSMPLWIAVMTMTATWVDGGYLLGTAEGVFAKNLAWALQPGVCFGISLILGGLVFARIMRRFEFTTIIDPFDARFGKRWSAVLFLPAMLGEVFWSASLLVAIGSTFQVILGLDATTSIWISAAVVTFYTMLGGMWSVAYTDAVQLMLIPIGLFAVLPFAVGAAGGWGEMVRVYTSARPVDSWMPPLPMFPNNAWPAATLVAWWDTTCMLMLGGIPWNCYFQRILSCQTPEKAREHSLWAGILTITLTIPPALLGIAFISSTYRHLPGGMEIWEIEAFFQPSLVLPYLLRYLVPYAVGVLGLAAIVGAVTSSFSSSILSAGSMFSWNVVRRLVRERITLQGLKFVIRTSIVVLGLLATIMALKVRSVLELWVFSSDLIFVLLFPQLVCALFDSRTNRIGSMVAFVVSLGLRLAAGEPLFGIPPLLPHVELVPMKTIAAAAGLVLLPVVSRLTARWDPPMPLRKMHAEHEYRPPETTGS